MRCLIGSGQSRGLSSEARDASIHLVYARPPALEVRVVRSDGSKENKQDRHSFAESHAITA